MEQYATYADYVAAMNAVGNNPISQAEFETAKKANTDFTLANTNIVENPNEILGDTTGQLGDLNIKDPALADTGGLDVTSPTAPTGLGQIDQIAQTRPNLGTMDAAQGTFTGAINPEDVTGTVSEGAIAKGVTEELDPRATTSYQLADLFKSIEDGKPLPPWASPAVRKVSSLMNARGVGASSMGAAAMTQAIMESGITIAAQDAKAYSQIQLVNLTNKQKGKK